MWNHPNKTQSNWDRPAPFSSLHQTSPLELKDVYFHEETNPQFPKAEISPKCIPYALGRAMSSWESPVVSPKIPCTFTRSATPKLLPAPLLLYPAQLLLQRKILGSTLGSPFSSHAELQTLPSCCAWAEWLLTLLQGFICVMHIFHMRSFGQPGMETALPGSSECRHREKRHPLSRLDIEGC